MRLVLFVPVNADDVIFHAVEPPRRSNHPIVALITLLSSLVVYIIFSYHSMTYGLPTDWQAEKKE
jgi:hypothetical protein